jgi:hypothetical protein
MKMRVLLKVKVPGKQESELVSSAPHDGTVTSLAAAFEYLAKQRDGWQATGVFPANSTWEVGLSS